MFWFKEDTTEKKAVEKLIKETEKMNFEWERDKKGRKTGKKLHIQIIDM